MIVLGVVGEFNPFHRGHQEHFEQSRRLAGEDAPLVCVMSGDFVQRGGPAVFAKQARAEMAAAAGADVVLELPLPWCMVSAEPFAMGAVGLLDALGVVTHLSFGSEAGDLAPLQRLARACASPQILAEIRSQTRAGLAFAPAREAVLSRHLGSLAELLRQPNNILAVEYCKALDSLHSSMVPLTTRREATVHDARPDHALPGAGPLRTMLLAGGDIAPYVPAATQAIVARESEAGRGPVGPGSLDQGIMARLRMLDREAFARLPDAGQGLGLRLWQAVQDSGSLAEVLARAGSKSCPTSRLRRMAFAAALGLDASLQAPVPPYARLLAFSARGRALLRLVRRRSRIPLLTRPAAVRDLPGRGAEFFTLTARARDFYVLGYPDPAERKAGSDWRSGPVVMDNG